MTVRRFVALSAVLSMLVTLTPALAIADDLPADAERRSDVAEGLLGFTAAFAGIGQIEELATPIPLTATAAADVLGLDRVLAEGLRAALIDGTDTTLAGLEAVIESADGIENASVSYDDTATDGPIDVSFDIDLERTIPVPLAYDDNRLQFGTAEITGGVTGTLTSTLHFTYDPAQPDPLLQFALVEGPDGAPVIDIAVKTTGAPTAASTIARFPAVDGFVETSLVGGTTIDWSTRIVLRDPNGRGQLTLEDLLYETSADLFVVSDVGDTDMVEFALTESSTLTSATGTVVVSGAPATGEVFPAVDIDRSDELALLTSITREEAVTGFAQYSSAALAIQATVDADLPFLDGRISDLFAPADDLVDLLREQATVAFACGATDTTPPAGTPAPGAPWYCQATVDPALGTLTPGATPTWSVRNGTIVSAPAGAVGQPPTANAKLTTTDGLDPQLTLSFATDDEAAPPVSTTRTARSLVRSAQVLAALLADRDLSGTLSFSPTTTTDDDVVGTLEFAIARSTADPSATFAPGSATSLGVAVGLRGLVAADGSTAAVAVDAGAAAFAATFGIALDADRGEGAPADLAAAVDQNRYYLRTPSGGSVYSIDSVAGALAGSADLAGRIGFLGVDASLASLTIDSAGSPAIDVTVPVGTVVLPGGASVTNAVAVRSLLSDDGGTTPTAEPVGTANVSVAAALSVSDAPLAGGARLLNTTGNVTATWADLLPTTLPTATTNTGYDALRELDVVPTVLGRAGAGSTGTTLIDSSAHFLRDFRVDANDVVERTLYALDAGATCSAFTVVSDTELTCTLLGDRDDEVPAFADGEVYVVHGEEYALRDDILDAVAGVLGTFAGLDDEQHTATLPLLDVRPDELAPERDVLGELLAELLEDADDGNPNVATLQALLPRLPEGTTSLSGGSLGLTFAESSNYDDLDLVVPLRIPDGDTVLTSTHTASILGTSTTTIDLLLELATSEATAGTSTGTHSEITGVGGSHHGQPVSWAGVEVFTGPVAADIVLGMEVAVDTVIAAPTPLTDLGTSLTTTRTALDGSDLPDCALAGDDPLSNAACARIPLFDGPAPDGVEVTVLRYSAAASDSSGGGGGAAVAVANLPVALKYTGEALRFLADGLDEALDGDVAGLRAPLVGAELDAGADVGEAVTAYLNDLRGRLGTIAITEVVEGEDGQETVDRLVSAVKADVEAALAAAAASGAHDVGHDAAIVEFKCGDGACQSDDPYPDVDEVEVTLTLTADAAQTSAVRFDVGLPGLPFDSNAMVPTTVSPWSLPVTFGITRGVGPYLEPHQQGNDPLLTVPIAASMPTRGTETGGETHACEVRTFELPDSIVAGGVLTDRCLDAVIGYLPGTAVDQAGNTSLSATTQVTLPDKARLGLLELSQTGLPTTTSFDGTSTGAIDLAFQTWAADLGFLDVVGTLDVAWTPGGGFEDPEYGELFLVAPAFVGSLVAPMQEANRWLKPFRPVVDVLQAPIPVISPMSEMIGAGKVSLLTMMDKPGSKLEMVARIGGFVGAVAQVLDAASQVEDRYIPLGALEQGLEAAGEFVMDVEPISKESCTETFQRKGTTTTTGGTTTTTPGPKTKQSCEPAGDETDAQRADTKKGDKLMSRVDKSASLSIPSLSFPILQDASQVFDVITGAGDATVLHIDFGTASASIAYSKFFGPFAIGPVPVQVVLGGAISLEARFALGFDTRALRQAVERLDDPGSAAELKEALGAFDGGALAEGFYIDDLDGSGEDVPEVTFIATLTVGAAVSIGIFSAGVTGGVDFIIDLDLVDPDGDGKLRVEEFALFEGKYECAFTVSSGLEFFLEFFLKMDLGFFGTWSKVWELYRSPRIILFEHACDPIVPVLAKVENDGTQLRLTMGTHKAERLGFLDKDREKYIVRQLGSAAPGEDVTVEVSAFGLSELHTVDADATVLVADAGAGADVVELQPGQIISEGSDGTRTITSHPVTLSGNLSGGGGNDRLIGGDRDDVLNGGDANDTLEGGLGADTLTGGPGADSLDGGIGDDILSGGTGDDSLAGGAGADRLFGGAGDDRLIGGPGVHPAALFPLAEGENAQSAVAPILDGGDMLVGGAGSDLVDGAFGSDLVSGGDAPTSWATRAIITRPVTVDVLTPATNGAPAQIVTTSIDVSTVTPLTAAEVDEACTPAGGVAVASTDRDDVTGGPDADQLIGGPGPDRIDGGGGADVLCGLEGDDLLLGDGEATSEEDAGDDDIRGGPGADRLYGDAGDDTISGGTGNDLARGGADDDTIAGGSGADLLLGEDGIDTIDGEAAGTVGVELAPPLSERLVDCVERTQIVHGLVDLTGDLAGTAADDGILEGFEVVDGTIQQSGAAFDGLIGDVVVIGGLVDADGSGTVDGADTRIVDLAGMRVTNTDGDCIFGGDAADDLSGGTGSDHVAGGTGNDTIAGGTGNDFLLGNAGDDVLTGDEHHDVLVGGAGDDHLTGSDGDDRLRGGEGDDRLIGGSSTAGAKDGEDLLLGGRGMDVLAGENAVMRDLASGESSDVPGTYVQLLAGADQTRTPVIVPDGDFWDELYGGFGDDWVFGQAGDDLVRGGHDDDLVEGGPGNDLVKGDDGDDMAVGGSSVPIAGTMDPTRVATGTADGDDEVHGDGGVDGLSGRDVVAGDNARLRRLPSGAVDVHLFDVTADSPAASASGDDDLWGGGADDRIFGQGGNDTIHGGAGLDVIEGNAGADVIFGDDGADTIVGGSTVAGEHDGNVDVDEEPVGDTISGGEGDDVILGDNGHVTAGVVQLLDVLTDDGDTEDTDDDAFSGDDTILGGAGADRLFGQGGDDAIHGGAGDDYVEGNHGSDLIAGDDGQDDLIGGGSADDGTIDATRVGDGLLDGGDTIFGGSTGAPVTDSHDVIAGDNARIVRVDGTRPGNAANRTIQLFDVLVGTAADTEDDLVSGGDAVDAGAGNDRVFGQGGPDTLHGNDGDDYLEGNHASDTITGDGGEDDILGGSSATNGAIVFTQVVSLTVSLVDRLQTTPTAATDASARGLVDAGDLLYGGSRPGESYGSTADSHDVVLGDNGRITRNGTTLAGTTLFTTRAVRAMAMADLVPGPASGSDAIWGGPGDDGLYGQFDDTDEAGGQAPVTLGTAEVAVLGDLIYGDAGDDAIIADQGVETPTLASTLGAQRTLTTKSGFVSETVLTTGSLVRVVELTQIDIGGDDVVFGGAGADAIHTGAGDDAANGGDGRDILFGADGDDALWGGIGRDHLYGGLGSDWLDVKPRAGLAGIADDDPLWFVVAPEVDTDDSSQATTNGADIIFGGWGQDAMQADEGSAGADGGDRLMDWSGAYNAYYVCGGAYGAGQVLREPGPGVEEFLLDLARADGAVAVTTADSSGWTELRFIYKKDIKANNSPTHPDHPGNFACDGG